MNEPVSKKDPSFEITLFTAMDQTGRMRNSQESDRPLWDNNPEIIKELNRIAFRKIILMGRKTYELLLHDATKHVFLNDAAIIFVLTKKRGDELIKKEHTSHVYAINALEGIRNFWWLLEEAFEEKRRQKITACRKVQNDWRKKPETTGTKENSESPMSNPKDKELVEQLEKTIDSIEQEKIPIQPEIVVLGGVSLYQEMIDYATAIYAFLIHAEFTGEEKFPLFFNEQDWEIKGEMDSKEKDSNGYPLFTSITYRRKAQPEKHLPFFRPDLPPLPVEKEKSKK
ncbi:MAG: dihydrofolate reductase [Parcubacteria group bacterium]|nr:dihydrofolate reductase [Parcubacteria group bacterium]